MVDKGLLKAPFNIYGAPSPRLLDELSPQARSFEISPRFSGTPASNNKTTHQGFQIHLMSLTGATPKAEIESQRTESAKPFAEYIQKYISNIRQSQKSSQLMKQPSFEEEDAGRKSAVNIDYGMTATPEQPPQPEENKKDLFSSMFDSVTEFVSKPFKDDPKPSKDHRREGRAPNRMTPPASKTDVQTGGGGQSEKHVTRPSTDESPFSLALPKPSIVGKTG